MHAPSKSISKSALHPSEPQPSSLPPSPPHSAEAEEHVLAVCLLDNGETLTSATAAGINEASFYIPKNRAIFSTLLAMKREGVAHTIELLAAELDARKLFEQIGGWPYLTQITHKIPTTAHAKYFIEKLRELELRRDVIKSATAAIAKAGSFTGNLADAEQMAAEIAASIAPKVRENNAKAQTFTELLAFDFTKDPDCLLGNRYLGRTNSLVIAAPSGVGKSVLSVQISILAAAGLPILGLKTHAPLRVLYVQAEDDVGDVAEAVQGVDDSYALTKEQQKLIEKNFRAIRWTDCTGERFISRLLGEWSRWPFDLVIINPLFSFAGCDLIDQSQASHFLRHQLNPLLVRTNAAAIVVHHTKKPNSDPDHKPSEDNAAYDSFGSSEITNWARATISLQMVKGAGKKVCKLIFSKRGNRAGILDNGGNPTNSIQIEHAKDGLCWVSSDWKPATESNGRFKATKWDQDKAEELYDKNQSWAENERRLAAAFGMDRRGVSKHRKDLEPEA